MWWNNKQGAERSRREERLNLLPASQEMRHDVGVWSTHPSRTIPPLHQKLFFHTHTHTHMHMVLLAKVPTIHCGSRSPESSLALSRCTSVLTLFFLMSPWWIKHGGNRTYFHACSSFNKDRGFNFSIVAKLTRCIPNGDVGCFLESPPPPPRPTKTIEKTLALPVRWTA